VQKQKASRRPSEFVPKKHPNVLTSNPGERTLGAADHSRGEERVSKVSVLKNVKRKETALRGGGSERKTREPPENPWNKIYFASDQQGEEEPLAATRERPNQKSRH